MSRCSLKNINIFISYIYFVEEMVIKLEMLTSASLLYHVVRLQVPVVLAGKRVANEI